jgi:hypothetical protein
LTATPLFEQRKFMTRKRGRKPAWGIQGTREELTSNEPLRSLLIAESRRRSETRQFLAKQIGVSYSMLLKWGHGEAPPKIARASPRVQGLIATYLGIPRIFVLLLSGAVTLDDFRWTGFELIERSQRREMKDEKMDYHNQSEDWSLTSAMLQELASILEGDWEQGKRYKELTLRWIAAASLDKEGGAGSSQ